MAQTSWPFENVDTSETQFSQWARNIGEGVKAGVGGELLVSGDGSGMNVKVAAGQSMVRGHYYSNTAIQTLTITPSDLTNPRIDNVVLELDPAANTILLKVVAGTPASSPVAPTLVQTDSGVYQQLLAYVDVEANETAIGAPDVSDERSFLGGAKAVVKTVAATAYTLSASDSNKFLRFTSNDPITLTVNDGFTVGQRVDVYQKGEGVITFTEGTGSIEGAGVAGADLVTNAQFAAVSIFCESAGVYAIVGNVSGA
jgi:uncharacterized protein YjdB